MIRIFARGLLRLMETPPKETVPTAPVADKTPEPSLKAERAVRLAAALRANLKRRKAPRAAAPSAKDRN
ncbi:hypothetical protein [Brevundimonas sp.]|uniref:hypothetical protein n=1 Tax=Brevundimonas sp. TaxID=1871086 RepID=UPI003D6D257E